MFRSTNLAVIGCLLVLSSYSVPSNAQSVEGVGRQSNPYAYLDAYSDSYYPGTKFPKLTTPQWVGEAGVEAVVTLGIDDMRDTAKYEGYLRPILKQLKQIDGRAPVSIMTCKTDPSDPQLQRWLAEGLSIETHTKDHPCPCLQGGDFSKAKATYDSCVDTMFAIPNSQPVAFRFPCMDSLNTPSPRAFAEIVNKTTPQGNFLQASSSVVCVFDSSDPELPKSLTLNDDGEERFQRYIPFTSFVNKVANYPYPYLIGKRCWEFPCTIPDDWQAQNIQQPCNPRTLDDMVAAIDATVIKQGIANIVFHPYEWIRNDQMASVVQRVNARHGGKIKFLTFRECIDRINKHLLLGQSVRSKDGGDNGVRILDLNQDGFLDVMIGNENVKLARVWQPESNQWHDVPHPIQFTDSAIRANAPGELGRLDMGVRVGQGPKSEVIFLVHNENEQAMYEFNGHSFVRSPLSNPAAQHPSSARGIDQGIRLRDIDRDGVSELLVANQNTRLIYKRVAGHWTVSGEMPAAVVDSRGRDNGLRFVDVDGDEYEDVIVSNATESAIHLYDHDSKRFMDRVDPALDIPMIVRSGTNNGAWFAERHMWVQNEDTHRLPDGVDRRELNELLGKSPAAKSPAASLSCIQVRKGFTVELVAAEPMVMDPVALDWGPDGKLWVAEMADYPLGLDDRGKPGGRVRYLEDTNGDGKYDKSTLFLDNIAYPTGVIAWRDGVIVSAAPVVFFAADRDGDGKAEHREDLYRGFAEGNQQHLVNGFERGLDNWLYLANGDSGGTVESLRSGKKVDIRGQDLRIRPSDGSLQAEAGRTQFGRHRDDHGNWFGCSNPLPVRHYILSHHYLRRNPHVAPPSSYRDIATVSNTQIFPVSRVLSHWSGYKPPAPGTGHKFTSACSTIVYRDNLFGPDFASDTFTCEPVHNAVHRRKLIPDGISFRSVRPDDEVDTEFLASTDSWFRPATVTTGPDGALWIVDMYRLVIEHPEWIDDEREKELFLRAGHDCGRIYRVYPKGKKPRPTIKLNDLNSRELVANLGWSNGRLRDMTQALLIERNDRDRIPQLKSTVHSADDPMARLHALCTLDGMNATEAVTVVAAIRDQNSTVRRHGIRIAEQFLANDGADAERVLSALANCDALDAHVRMQLAYSLGESQSAVATRMLANMALLEADDIYLRSAIISSLNQDWLEEFYEVISANADVVTRYRTPLLQMAVRCENQSLLSSMVARQVMRISQKKDPTAFHCFAETLGAIRSHEAELDLTSQEKIRQAVNDAFTVASDVDFAIDLRVAAVKVLGVSGQHDNDLMNLIAAQEPIEIQVVAAQVLSTSKPDELLKRFRAFSPSVRTAVLDSMFSRKWTILKVIEAIESRTIPSQTLRSVDKQTLRNHYSDEIKQAATRVLGSDRSSADKRSLMNEYSSASPLAGDAQRGMEVFAKHCSACHQVKGVGHIVGPDLAAIKNRSADAMLTAILDPNAAVEDKYQIFSVLTLDGVAVSGLIANESSTAITLKMQEGKTKTILRDDIESIQSTGVSLMPEEFEKSIPLADMNDLLAFLVELGPAPKSFAGNAPQTVGPGNDGRIQLDATTCRIYGEQLVFEPQYQNIGYWSNSDDYVEWTFTVNRPGKYKVIMDYACPDHTSGNRFRFACGTKMLSGKIAGTGTWDDYREVELGIIELTGHTMTGAFRGEPGMRKNLLDLRSITLQPVP